MNTKTRMNRRNFLRGAGSVAVALPFLEGLPERSAFAQSQNPVFGLFICTANGVVQAAGGEPERFWPMQTGALTKESMSASAAERCTGLLADYADRLLIVKGIKYPFGGTGCGHAQGLVQCLTAAQPSGTDNKSTSSGPSVDTVIADRLKVEPLTLYSGMKGGYIDEKLSFSAAGKVRAAEGNPWNVYQRLMQLAPAPGGMTGTAGSTGTSTADRLVLRRKSVNDLVFAEYQELKNRSDLSKADVERLDLHFQNIRDMENTMVGMGLACSTDGLDTQALQAMNSGSAFKQNGKIEDVAKLQMELVAFAFACNATRVATLQIGDGTDGTRYTVNGKTVERFHWVSHRIQSDGSSGAAIPEALEWHTAIDRIRMETFKHLLTKWSAYTTPAGNLLDSAFAMWTSHVATGPAHSFNNLPIIIAGSGGGFLKQGQYITVSNTNNNKLHNTLISAAVGTRVENFGGANLAGGLIDTMLAA